MPVDKCLVALTEIVPPVDVDLPSVHREAEEDAQSLFDPDELESLGLVLDYSLKVHTTHQFYCWTQGLLQNLIRHELLICAQRKGETGAFVADSFTVSSTQPSTINDLFGQDTSLVANLMKAWEENGFLPVIWDVQREASAADSALARELCRIEACDLLVHGTHDAFGKPVSVFIFACRTGSCSHRLLRLARLVVPSVHVAWMHTQFVRPVAQENARSALGGRDLLTAREMDILGWIYRGKSNIEIGLILGISPFTVKNHVEKILRRLNVLNRAQAVGKAMALRIFDSSSQC